MIKKLFLLLTLLTVTSVAHAQGVAYSNIALTNASGTLRPVPSAVITVCAANVSSTPCSPVSSIFNDYLLSSAKGNPFNADANGNYSFFAAPGNYTITVTGVGIAGYSYQATLGGGTVAPSNCTPTTHGLVPTPPNDATKFLNGQCGFTNPSGLGGNTIFPTLYGVKADGQACFGIHSTVTITSGSADVTCSTASYTSADIGKRIAGTSGCCGTTNNYTGLLCIKGTISSINSATSVHVSANATCTPSGTTGELWWGTPDDTALSAAETAFTTQQPCGSMAAPSGIIWIKEPHFNTASCTGITFTQDYGGMIYGQGPAGTIFALDPDFDFAACPVNAIHGGPNTVCFFNYLSSVVVNLGFNGMGYGNTGNHTGVSLIGLLQGSQSSQLTCTSFGGSDAGMVGIRLDGGSRNNFLISDGCGYNSIFSSSSGINAFNYLFYAFGADSLGPGLRCGGGNIYDFGGEWGPIGDASGTYNAGNSDVLIDNCNYGGHGSSNFVLGSAQKSLTGNTALNVVNGGNADLTDTTWDNSSECVAACSGIVIGTTSHVTSRGSTFKGLLTGTSAGIVNAGGFGGADGGYFDNCGNTVSSYIGFPAAAGFVFGSCSITGIQLATGNLVLSANWGTGRATSAWTGATAPVTFTITNGSAATGAAPTIAYTFPKAYLTAPLWCTATQVGGTNATGTFTTSALSATGVTFTFSLTPTVNLTEFVQVVCPTE